MEFVLGWFWGQKYIFCKLFDHSAVILACLNIPCCAIFRMQSTFLCMSDFWYTGVYSNILLCSSYVVPRITGVTLSFLCRLIFRAYSTFVMIIRAWVILGINIILFVDIVWLLSTYCSYIYLTVKMPCCSTFLVEATFVVMFDTFDICGEKWFCFKNNLQMNNFFKIIYELCNYGASINQSFCVRHLSYYQPYDIIRQKPSLCNCMSNL